MDDFITSADVARLLGVGASSVKRWADDGLLPCVRTPGGHRRFARSEVERFSSAQRSERQLDPAQVEAWLQVISADGGPYDVHSALLLDRSRLGSWWATAELLGSVLDELGRRWESDRICVLEEHAASERLARGLARCAEAITVRPRGPRALVATAAREEHTLGLQLAELVLLEAGWTVRWGGRGLPSDEIVRWIERGACDLVALSASPSSTDPSPLLEQARVVGAACHAHTIPLVLGGRGAWPRPSEDLPHFHRLQRFRELHELLESLGD